MGETTSIGWTDHTFNIAWGCLKVSPGCNHCYADTWATRWGFDVWGPPKTTARRTFDAKHWAEPLKWNAKAEAEGVRRRVFCSSMCDVFEDHPTIIAELAKLWPLIRATPWLDWQLLTKRPERIAANLPSDWGERGYANVWLGTSVESLEYIERIADLLKSPAAVHFLSAEPLLGRLDVQNYLMSSDGFCLDDDGDVVHVNDGGRGLSWIICGGESGPGARSMDLEWARLLRDHCEQIGTAFFLKQLGGSRDKREHHDAVLDGRTHTEFPSRILLSQAGTP